jgi:hypothetical protein
MMALDEQQLAKLTIVAFSDQGYTTEVGRWQALFNPPELSFAKTNNYSQTASAGSSHPQIAYTGSEPDEITLELFFDGTGTIETSQSVRERVEELLALTTFQSDTHQPYYLRLLWGPHEFRGVRTKADVKYTLFDRVAEPLRGTVSLTITQAISPAETSSEERRESPNLYQTWLVTDEDTLDGIAHRVYGDPVYWRPLAAANRLVNARQLTPGQILVLPPKEN